MKAWIAHDGSVADGCLLVYAETRNKARQTAAASGICVGFLDEYIYVRCRRMPQFDKWYRDKQIIMQNTDLPKECPLTFYTEDIGE